MIELASLQQMMIHGFRSMQWFPSLRLIKRSFMVIITCLFAIGGAVAGFLAGCVVGFTTASGLGRGCSMGVVSGVIIALELLDSLIDGSFMSKVALFGTSLINGKVFSDWVCPAMLKAYQSQAFLSSFPENEDSDLYSLDDGPRGLDPKLIDELPTFQIQQCQQIRCTICLDDLKLGESARELRSCGHCFHKLCIDAWLIRRASCPVCRNLMTPTLT